MRLFADGLALALVGAFGEGVRSGVQSPVQRRTATICSVCSYTLSAILRISPIPPGHICR